MGLKSEDIHLPSPNAKRFDSNFAIQRVCSASSTLDIYGLRPVLGGGWPSLSSFSFPEASRKLSTKSCGTVQLWWSWKIQIEWNRWFKNVLKTSQSPVIIIWGLGPVHSALLLGAAEHYDWSAATQPELSFFGNKSFTRRTSWGLWSLAVWLAAKVLHPQVVSDNMLEVRQQQERKDEEKVERVRWCLSYSHIPRLYGTHKSQKCRSELHWHHWLTLGTIHTSLVPRTQGDSVPQWSFPRSK